MYGKLKKAMCSTRNAAQPWSTKCSVTLREFGFVIGVVSPCHFCHAEPHVCGLLHGGDFVFVGRDELVQVVAGHIASKTKEKGAVM